MGCVDRLPDTGYRTDSRECQRLVEAWVNECVRSHQICKPALKSAPYLPARLLDLLPKNNTSGCFKIVEGALKGPDSNYACLSHCWGNVQPLRLTKETAEQLMDGMPVHVLPPTYRDAVMVCGWLGIRYLWIDSLCILQDSEDDWKIQSFQMRSVFKNAYLTIAAAHGSTCQTGIFNERNPVGLVLPLGELNQIDAIGEDEKRIVTVLDVLFWESEVENCLLNSRAWVLQVGSAPHM